MNPQDSPNEQQLERSLQAATTGQPLEPTQHDSETQQLREAWDALQGNLQELETHSEESLDAAALWEYANAPREEVGGVQYRSSSAASRSRSGWLLLVATAATLALVAFGRWQFKGSGSHVIAPVPIVQPSPPLSQEPVPIPEPAEQFAEQEDLTNDRLPTAQLKQDPEADLYAWNDDLDESIASAASTAHDIRHGWRNTSDSYRYISTRFESISESLEEDSL